MALVGVEDTAVFSIVVGNRTGQLDNETPATMCAHIVSIDAARYLDKSITGKPYDETNDPVLTDYIMVLSWLLERMFSAGVPAHCLIPDPTYLEAGGLRLFCINKN
ncbi:hypothetical protein F4859DRAFT_518497 [Xylaria cf. heliscus]|nr:hypothetical protein F4859DRAFT_518497 [Xylaria cf. heliscus]